MPPKNLAQMTLSGIWQNDPDIQNLTFEQVTAVVDALMLALYADGLVRPQEEQMLEKYLLALPCSLDELVDLEAYIGERREAMGAPRSKQELEEAAEDIAGRLPDSVSRQVYSMVVALVVADMELRGKEQAALLVFASVLDLDADEAATVFAQTCHELGIRPG